MLKATVVIGIVAVAMAAIEPLENLRVQFFRVGSVGASSSMITGLLVPTSGAFDEAIPTYEFRSTVNGVPIPESEFYNSRCSVIDDYYVPFAKATKPVLLCRGIPHEKGTPEYIASKIVFLLSAEELSLPPAVKDINLLFGKATYNSFLSSHDLPIPVVDSAAHYGLASLVPRLMEDKYDGYKLLSAGHPYKSLLEPRPVTGSRNMRQYLGVSSTTANGYTTTSVSGYPSSTVLGIVNDRGSAQQGYTIYSYPTGSVLVAPAPVPGNSNVGYSL